MAIKVTFNGGRELERALAQLEKAATRKSTARRALKQAAEPIAAKAESFAPARTTGSDVRKVGGKGNKRTVNREKGALKSHINISARLTKRQAANNRKMGKSEVEIHVGTRDRVGRLQEFGTADAAAQPFMRPAWDADGGEKSLDRISEFMWSEIDKSAARQAKRKAKG